MSIRVALMLELSGRRHFLVEQLSKFRNIDVGWQGNDPSSRSKELKRYKPDVIILETGTSFSPEGLMKSVPRLVQRLKKWGLQNTKILISTELKPDDQFVRDMYKGGINFIHEGADIVDIVKAIEKTHSGERVFHFSEGGRGSESFGSDRGVEFM